MTDTPAFQPLSVNCRGSVADALQARRIQLGKTLADLDHESGNQSGYCAKLLRPGSPAGRKGVHFKAVSDRLPSGDIVVSGASEFLTECLGLCLVVVDRETVDRIGAVPAPRHSNLTGGSPALHHDSKRKGARVMSCGQHEALHGAKVARDLLQVSVVAHPFVSENPVLRAEAEAIASLLDHLYARIRASV